MHSFLGYPHIHGFRDVTNVKFDGCINNITITGEPIDLRNNLKSYDVTPGCPAKVTTFTLLFLKGIVKSSRK